MTTMIDYALAYARRGWKVFPLAVRDKVPLIAKENGGNGCLDATTDRNQILKWWSATPNANIGIATGHDFFVVDIDPKHNGHLWLESVDLPDTIQQQTGSGGTHYIFSGPPDIQNSAGKIAPGVDIRGVGGYIVAPPSIHPNGRPYTWVDCDGIPEDEPALSPVWLLNQAGKKSSALPPIGDRILKGTQHETLWKYACSIWGGKVKYTEAEVMAAVLTLSKRCEEVPPEKNVEKIVYSVTRKHPPGLSPEYAAKARTAPPPEPQVEHTEISGDWQELLHRDKTKDKNPRPVLINVDVALRYSPEWQGVLAYDEFKQKVMVVKSPPIGGHFPRNWTDADDTNATVWMQSNGIYVGREIVGSAIQSVAADNKVHVVRDYLDSLQWDGVHRIDNWLSVYMGVPNNALSRMVGPRWLISAVARIMSPGCQVDYMMVIEGVEGIKKSSALATLASQEWFCDHTPDLHDKDSQMQLSGAWIVEWPELENLRKSEITAVKQFLTRRVEKFRPPYGRYTVEVPRQCVFAGTTNEIAWNKSDTGARRFWPVRCESTDNDALRRDRDQIWAEALTRYLDGSIWWPETEDEHKMLSIEQDARIEEDPWQQSIEKYLEGDDLRLPVEEITVADLLSKCLGIPISEHDQGKKNRVGRALRSLGWKYVQERVQGSKKHFSGYQRPSDPG